MTSAARKTNDAAVRPGFSLLEMVVVLAVVAMVVAGAAGAMYFNRDEGRLTRAMGEIEVMAKRARSVASLQQRPYALEFSAEGVAMMPYAEALLPPDDRAYFAASEQAAAGQPGAPAPGVRVGLEMSRISSCRSGVGPRGIGIRSTAAPAMSGVSIPRDSANLWG